MANEKLRNKVRDVMMKSVNICRDFQKTDFKKIISEEKFNMILYSSKNKNTNYYGLGLFNFLFNLASNVHAPKTVSSKKPNGQNYIEYFFSNGKLKLTRHINNGELGLSFYVGEDYVVELTERRNCEASCVWLLNGRSQMFVSCPGTTEVIIITDIGDGYYRREDFDPFTYISTIYELSKGIYYEVQVERRCIMPSLDEAIDFMKKYDPYCADHTGDGIIKISKSTWESFKESGWEIL